MDEIIYRPKKCVNFNIAIIFGISLLQVQSNQNNTV